MILEEIVEAKKKRLPEHKALVSEEKMKELALASQRKTISFYDALAKEGLSIIGEFKKASPSMGVIDNKLELTDRIDQYNHSVDAISVLTEQDYFHGGVDYLKKVRGISNLPIIRKDFIIEEYQVYEAKVIGADAILLIAAILDDEQFKKLYNLAYSLGLDVLCEVHDETEMKRMLDLDVKIIGINNRNLKTFEIELSTTTKLSQMVPKGKVLVSESGVIEDSHIELLKESNVDALLIGRAFMESRNPGELAGHWKKVYDAGN
ncbi:MAG: indole-3-glycerol phosphate synthase TrpC [Thermoflexaceae bacterium]|nr:indole-3-glycerol phosphate synthase TrpC [Thermoflexaceae bacterium]